MCGRTFFNVQFIRTINNTLNEISQNQTVDFQVVIKKFCLKKIIKQLSFLRK